MKLFKKVGIIVFTLSIIFSGNVFSKTSDDCNQDYVESIKALVKSLNEGSISSSGYTSAKKSLDSGLLSCKKEVILENSGSSECPSYQEKNYLGNCVDKELTEEQKCDIKDGVYFSSDKSCSTSEIINTNSLITKPGIKGKIECDEVKGLFDLNTGKCTVYASQEETQDKLTTQINPSTGEPYTQEEAAIRAAEYNTTDGATNNTTSVSSQNTGPAFTAKAKTLEEYCREKGKNFSDSGLMKYDGVCKGAAVDKSGSGYSSFISTANEVISWIVDIALLIAAAVAFYGGFLYISAATDPAARTKANKLFTNIAIGLFLIFAAWFIVKFILTVFAKGDATTTNVDQSGNFTGLQK